MTTLTPPRDLTRQQPPLSAIEPQQALSSSELVTRNGHAESHSPASDTPSDFRVAHHYATAQQQSDAAKLGMWLFLATEVLLFGGLFCLYAVFRNTQPDVFRYGARFLDVNLGALNTTVLILSSMTMAWAVRCAQLNQRRRLIVCLLLTILGGAMFMGVKYIEYSHKIRHNLVWGLNFYHAPSQLHEDTSLTTTHVAQIAPAEKKGDAIIGQTLWMGTCRSCHDVDGRGIAGQGKDLRGSAFIASKTDKQLVEFVKVGRMPFDKLNTTGVQMPPRGGNPLLKDEQLLDIIAHMRSLKAPQPAEIEAALASASSSPAAPAPIEEFYIPKSVMPDASTGPTGLAVGWDRPAPRDLNPPRDPRLDPTRPPNAHLFFGVYFLMTGLHGLHVLAGIACISWLTLRAWLGHFTSAYFTPVDLVGLYWHVVDLIWIFLFPLLYLIH
jgi:cytochrome c oxidase subunit III